MNGFIIFFMIFIIVASLFYLANTILIGILTIFYGDKAEGIAHVIVSIMLWVFGICVGIFAIFASFTLFGPIMASILLVVAFAIWLFIKSF